MIIKFESDQTFLMEQENQMDFNLINAHTWVYILYKTVTMQRACSGFLHWSPDFIVAQLLWQFSFKYVSYS